MAANRKLQVEIDRVLKKVQEGVEVFDTLWNKVHDTDNANQKEKYETELKKEIKKLQRYRDQIKTWLQSSDIKDKKPLIDARKLIEKEMERFKICEKETKTKAFSKEGLEQQPKTDPKEKAKSETRDWLNNTVSELESQIDSFEAEMEGLFVKKGKTRPPRLTHLESSIVRHKAHISKLELILRLLDNDGLSPEEVNDVKDFLEDYVERNQDDFDEFDDVDMLYNTLSLDTVDSLEELATIGLPALVKGVGNSGSVSSIKSSVFTAAAQLPATATAPIQQGRSVQESGDETASSSKYSAISSFPSTSSGPVATPVSSNALSSLSGPSSVKGISANSSSSVPPSPINSAIKEAEITSFPARKSSQALPEAGLKNFGRGSMTKPPSITIPITSGSTVSSSGSHVVSPVSETPKRTMLGGDEKLGSSGIVQPVVSSVNSRMVLPPGGKTIDAVTGGNSEGESMTGRVFSPPSMPWRPVNPFQSQLEGPRGRPEIAPDHKENFLQKFQQVTQQTQGILPGKQFTAQQNPLLQQFNAQSSAASLQGGMVGGPAARPTAAISSQQQSSSIHSQTGSNTEVGHEKADAPQQHQSPSGDSATSFVPDKNTANEGVSILSHTSDMQAGVSGSRTDPALVTRDIDLSAGQPLQSNQLGSLGVIGRRSVSDLGAVGDGLSGPGFTMELSHDLQTIMPLFESAFYKLPQPKDSEPAKSYIPRNPIVTPTSYPQAQAPIVSNPAFWERLGSDNIGTDTLFFAFYHQQNTYQQYLAAKELKKQAWRYHKKYNTWFQRHEEPKVATDDFEQGSYVYFDFHMGNNEMQEGWCQRVKTDFKFEYNFLEDELVV